MENKSKMYIIFQVLLWGFGTFSILLLLSYQVDLDVRFWTQTILTVLGVSIVVFVNLRWLMPKLYLQRRKLGYLLVSLILLIVVVWGIHSDILPWNQRERPSQELRNRDSTISGDTKRNESNDFKWLIRNLPPLFISLLGSSFVALSRFAREKERHASELERTKLKTDLRFLKSQINPHFLFNSLHNIYTLTLIQSDRASEKLLKLSDILRYMLYDTNEETVPLTREVEYLKNYLSLAQLKDSRGMNVSFNIEGEIILVVAPLLFIPFVENAFKHSQIENLKTGYIRINLRTSDNQLSFEVENSRPQKDYKKDHSGGIGLDNIKERLNLLYPDKHNLVIEKSQRTFRIHLKLDCS